MVVAYELSKDLSEIQRMPVSELTKWLAFFKIRDKTKPQAGRR